MKPLVVLLFLCVVFFGTADASPLLFFTDANVAHLKNPDGRAKVIRLAERGKNKIDAQTLAYRVTGDAKYAENVRAILLKECVRGRKKWSGGLNGAHRCFDMALGYDGIRDFLSPGERKTIASGIVSRGVEPMLNEWLFGKTRMTTLDSMGHNWWSACVFLPGVAALAVSCEEPRVLPWLERIRAATTEWFDYPGSLLNNKPSTFDPAGGFYESVGYANYGLSTYLILRTAWKNARKDTLPEPSVLNKTGFS